MTTRLAAVTTPGAPVNGAVLLVLLALFLVAFYALRGSNRACNADASRLTIRETRHRETRTQVLHPERLCMVKRCGNEYAHVVHGWRVCDDHAVSVAS